MSRAHRELCSDISVSLITRFTGSTTFQPLWLPHFQLEGPTKSRIRATAPTLRGAFNYVLDISDTLNERLQDCAELDFKLTNFDDLSMNELEIYEDPSEDPGVDVQARRQRVLTNMRDLRGKLQSKASSSICA